MRTAVQVVLAWAAREGLSSKFGAIRFLLLNVLVPLAVGGLVYLVWRSQSLLMFSWFRCFGLGNIIPTVRAPFASLRDAIPHWFLFSLPDGLWVYAVASYLGILWYGVSRRLFALWFSVGPLLGIGGEIGQCVGIVQGTFCVGDLLAYFLATALALFVLTREKGGNRYEVE